MHRFRHYSWFSLLLQDTRPGRTWQRHAWYSSKDANMRIHMRRLWSFSDIAPLFEQNPRNIQKLDPKRKFLPKLKSQRWSIWNNYVAYTKYQRSTESKLIPTNVMIMLFPIFPVYAKMVIGTAAHFCHFGRPKWLVTRQRLRTLQPSTSSFLIIHFLSSVIFLPYFFFLKEKRNYRDLYPFIRMANNWYSNLTTWMRCK